MVQIMCPVTNKICSVTGCFFGGSTIHCSLKPDHPTTASGSVAAPKEEKDFEALKWKVGTIMAEQFIKFNDGKFTAAIELNPATHALTEYLQSELTSLRQQLETLRGFVKEVDASLYHGSDLEDKEIMQHYIEVFKIIKEEARNLLSK